MQRVKIIKDYKKYKSGDVLVLSPNEAFGLIDSGYAVISKDIVAVDYKQKVPKPRQRGRFTREK